MRTRLALAYSGIFSIVAVVAAGTLWLAIARLEYSAVDGELATEARAVRALVAGGTPLPPGDPAGVVSDVFDGQGTMLETSGGGPSATALGPVARQAASSGVSQLRTETLDGVSTRVRADAVSAGSGGTRILVVTRPLTDTDQLVGTAATVLTLGTLVLVIAATVLGYGLAGTALRPVREIVAAARELNDNDLHRRITLELPDDEMGALADTFNAMLARLETSFDSLRRFTADAAHELRAPLTLIRTEVEVALSRTREAGEYQASLRTVLSETQRLGRMSDQLLMLARAEAGALSPQMSEVSLPALVGDSVKLWQPVAAEQSVAVTLSATGGTVLGDRDLLRRLVDNLVDNAVRYSPAHGTVAVSTRPVTGGWEIVVADEGPGVPVASRSSIFERFSRADESRGRDTGGAGLGLALCAAIAHLHGGSIGLDEHTTAGATFVVRLPASGERVAPQARARHARS